jgi:hypothetical protein
MSKTTSEAWAMMSVFDPYCIDRPVLRSHLPFSGEDDMQRRCEHYEAQGFITTWTRVDGRFNRWALRESIGLPAQPVEVTA